MGEVLVLRENREKTVLDTWTEVLKPQSEERTDVDIHSYFLSSVYRSQSGLGDKKRKNTFQVREAWKFRGVAQLVARGIWDAEVAGSNPVAPTIKSIWKNGWCLMKLVESRLYISRISLHISKRGLILPD